MKKMIVAALAVALAGPAIAQDQAAHPDDLLHFDWLSEEQRQRVDLAHSQLATAHREMCDVMIDIYSEHASRAHQSEMDAEDRGYLKRSCAAKSFAHHVDMSVHLHDRIHRESHAGE